MIKKFILVVMFLMLSTCPVLAQKLKVGLSAGWQPLEFYDQQGQLSGFSVDFALALGREMGREVEFVEGAWGKIFTGLMQGEFDMVLSSVSITSQRATMVAFSKSYLRINQVIVTLSASPTISFDQLAGVRLGVREFTTGYYLLKTAKAKVQYYDDMKEIINALLLGRLDGAVCDSSVAAYYVNMVPEYKGMLKITDASLDYEEYGIAVRKSDTELLEQLNQAIDRLQHSGELNAILERWLGQGQLH